MQMFDSPFIIFIFREPNLKVKNQIFRLTLTSDIVLHKISHLKIINYLIYFPVKFSQLNVIKLIMYKTFHLNDSNSIRISL